MGLGKIQKLFQGSVTEHCANASTHSENSEGYASILMEISSTFYCFIVF